MCGVFDMSASFVTINNSAHMAGVDAVHSCNRPLSLRKAELNDFDDIGIRDFGKVMAIAARPFTSTFLHHVYGVVFRGANKKVFRVNAPRVVAPVANVPAIRNGAVKPTIRVGVSPNRLSVNTKSAVPAGKSCAYPNPAIVSFLDVVIKALVSRHVSRRKRCERARRSFVVLRAEPMGLGFISALRTLHELTSSVSDGVDFKTYLRSFQ
jgi:hypothetical protein